MKSFFKKINCKFCSFLWAIFGLEALVVIYLLAPAPVEPVIVIDNSFAIITGQNQITEDNGIAQYTVSVTKDLDMDLDVMLDYHGSAIWGVDFKAPKKVVIKQGELSTTFKAIAINDNLKEGSETIIVKIANVKGKRFLSEFNPLDRAGVVYTIITDEAKPERSNLNTASLSLSCNKQLSEATGKGICSLLLSQKALEDINVSLAYSGKAEKDKDFSAPTIVTLKKGSAKVSFKIIVKDDYEKESAETLLVTVSHIDDVAFEDIRLVQAKATLTIVDEEVSSHPIMLSLFADKKQAIEGSKITYTLSLSEVALSDVKITLKHSNNRHDFNGIGSTVINKGEKTKTFTVNIVDDNIKEPNSSIEYGIAKIEQTGFEKIVANKAVKTKLKDKVVSRIADKQTAYLSLQRSNLNITENAKQEFITVISSQRVVKDLVIKLAYSGDARLNKDFDAPKKVTIKKGNKHVQFALIPLDDNLLEAPESLNIKIIGFSNSGLEDLRTAKGLNLQLKDEPTPTKIDAQTALLSLACPKQAVENTKHVICTIKSSQLAPKNIDIALDYRGKAVLGIDYQAPKKVTILSGKRKTSFKIKPINDVLLEGMEPFIIKISKIQQSGLEDLRTKLSTQTINMIDEKRPSKRITLKLTASKAVIEGEKANLTLKLSQKAVKDITVHLKSSKNSNSFIPVSTVLIPKGQSQVVFTVQTKDDNIKEVNETFSYSIKKAENTGFEALTFNNKAVVIKIIENKVLVNANSNTAYLSLYVENNQLSEDASYIKLVARLSQTAQKRVSLKLAYSGQAQQKIDFKAKDYIIIKKGASEGYIKLFPVNDNILEANETLNIGIAKYGNAGLEDIRKTKAISLLMTDERNASNSKKAQLTLKGPRLISEPKRSKPYTLSLSQPANTDMLIGLKYSGNASSKDYQQIKSVILKAGKQKITFRINTLDDLEAETLETLNVAIAFVKGGGFENFEFIATPVTTLITDEIDIANEFKKYIADQVVAFESGSTDVSEDSRPTLDKIALLLKKFSAAKLQIEGHTNKIGRAKTNLILSKKRAEAIKIYLVAKGVNASRVTAIGYGEEKPLLPYSNANAMSINKRVEFKVMY